MTSSRRSRCSVVLFTILLLVTFARAEQPFATIHTSNGMVLGICGDTIILRGVNYAPFNWGSDNTQLLLGEVAQSGANAVRMTWYANSSAPYYVDSLLDEAISTCIFYKMIPIIELHDITCDGTTAHVETLASWYATPTHVSLLNNYHNSLIINIANEVGFVNWAGNAAVAQQAYEDAYDSAINIIRNAGINVPLMIDAPDCGTSIDVLNNVAAHIINSDPKHNIIFSTHAYWYAYANNDSATMLQKITSALSQNFPLVIGEAANYQDSTDNLNNTYYCHWALNYPALLNICTQQNVGWLAWSWNNDNCALRQISTDGSYANLSSYGMDIINNPNYGLHNTAALTSYLKNGRCATAGIENVSDEKPYLVYNDNGIAYLKSLSPETLQLREFDILGRLIQQGEIASGQTLPLSSANIGIVQVSNGNRQYVSRFVSPQ